VNRKADPGLRLAGGRGLRLHGFNNLTKTLSFNIYDVCYACSAQELRAYLEYIDECYNAERLTGILHQVAGIIEARVLNVARADYEPHGASVTMLVADADGTQAAAPVAAGAGGSMVAHLDKSHLAVHTYPESHPSLGVSTFRVDIEVSTCGCTSPLKALDLLIDSFESDIVYIDYRVRGFTRDTDGTKHYMDHPIHSICDYIDAHTRRNYHVVDVNVFDENIFHSKLMLREFRLADYLFNVAPEDLSEARRRDIEHCLRREMQEIFEGRNRRALPLPFEK